MPSPALMACGMPAMLPEGIAAVARVAAVLDVVVDEREVVDEFERDRGGHGRAPHRRRRPRSRGARAMAAASCRRFRGPRCPRVLPSEVVAHVAEVADAGHHRWQRAGPQQRRPEAGQQCFDALFRQCVT